MSMAKFPLVNMIMLVTYDYFSYVVYIKQKALSALCNKLPMTDTQ